MQNAWYDDAISPFFTYAPNFDKQKACQAQNASVTLTYLMSTEYENTWFVANYEYLFQDISHITIFSQCLVRAYITQAVTMHVIEYMLMSTFYYSILLFYWFS